LTVTEEVIQGGGPGTAALITRVYLRRTNVQEKPVDVLSLDDVSTGTAQVQMIWRDNHHLDINHYASSQVGFYAASAAGDVEIAVH